MFFVFLFLVRFEELGGRVFIRVVLDEVRGGWNVRLERDFKVFVVKFLFLFMCF